MRIALLASEAVPFAKTGGLADVITALGKELAGMGHEVTAMMPLYAGTSLIPTGLMSPLRFTFGGRNVTYSLIETSHEGMRFVFVDAPNYFHRTGYYGDSYGDYRDNDERFIFFMRTCLDYYVRKDQKPDIFHCNDWQTALTPLFLRTHYYHHPLGRTPVIFTVHNVAYQGVFPPDRYNLLDIGWEFFNSNGLEFFGNINFLKGGAIYSDIVTTVSKKYSYEIQTPEFGHKLDGVFRSQAVKLYGVLNGIDTSIWDPAVDPLIARSYSAVNLDGKAECRADLLRRLGWQEDRTPVIGMISRLVAQKGFDLVKEIGEEILSLNLRMVILGSGEPEYEEYLQRLAKKYPDRVSVTLKFDDVLAHKIEAGADLFLMPSQFEPCGLNQMFSLKYGTVPVVRATGGLDDTVQEWDRNSETGNGFKFYRYAPEALLEAIATARNVFEDQDAWRKILLNGMSGDFSWKHSADQYLALYHKAIEQRA